MIPQLILEVTQINLNLLARVIIDGRIALGFYLVDHSNC